jgi:hypothetical protein
MRFIFYATNLSQPRSINHMFGNWINNQHKDFKQLIWVGVAAVCWAIGKCRNDIVFKRTKFNSILQVFSGELIGYASGPSCSVRSRPRTSSSLWAGDCKSLLYSLPMKDGIIFIVYLRWGHVASSCLSALFDFCLNSVIIGCVHFRM